MSAIWPTKKRPRQVAARFILAALAFATSVPLQHLWAIEPTSVRQRHERSAQKSELLGKTVRIAEGAIAYADLDVLREATDAVAKGKDITGKLQEWIKESRVFTVGIDSRGIVISTAGPKKRWVHVESHMNGKEVRLWMSVRDITEIPPESQSEAAKGAGPEKGSDLPQVKATAENLMRKIFSERLDRVEVYPHIDGGFNVLVFFNAAEGWSTNSTRRRIESDMRDAYRALYTSGVGVTDATMFAHAKMSDKFGRESNGLVYKTSMSKKTAEQVVWEKADSLDFTEIWETKAKRGGL